MSVNKYFKFDEINQFLEDQADINYYSTNQVRRVAIGNMLGDFDENGIYVLDKTIVKQLINMPKVIVDSVESADLIRSAIKFDGFIHFMLALEDDKAKLMLLEKINFESNIKYNAGSYSNMNEYVLCEITIPDKDIDRNAIYTKFNIRREDEGKYYDINDLTEQELANFDAIIKKMKYNILVQNQMIRQEKEIEVIEADYFDNVLNSFEDTKIRAEFEKLLKTMIVDKKDFILIDRPFFQKTINEILDSCLSLMFMKLSPDIRAQIEEKIRKAKEKYYKEYNNLIHINYVMDANTQIEASENSIINDLASSLREQDEVKVMRVELEENKLEDSFIHIIDENLQLKTALAKDNSDGKLIREDNPELSKFFNEIKIEYGIDMLQPANVVKTISKDETSVADNNIEVKKEEKSEAKGESKEADNTQAKSTIEKKLDVKSTSNNQTAEDKEKKSKTTQVNEQKSATKEGNTQEKQDNTSKSTSSIEKVKTSANNSKSTLIYNDYDSDYSPSASNSTITSATALIKGQTTKSNGVGDKGVVDESLVGFINGQNSKLNNNARTTTKGNGTTNKEDNNTEVDVSLGF